MDNIKMSYEAKMLKDFNMPNRKNVEIALLKSLFYHNGVIKEFGADEVIVKEVADEFNLDERQRNAFLKTIYHKENREKKSYLWHRLLFRAADSLAKEKLIIRPTQTFMLTNKKEWMLSESGFDKALYILNIPKDQKRNLRTKSYEVQKMVKKLKEASRPENYNPFDRLKKKIILTRETSLRMRGFRQAVIESYDYKCSVCGMKLYSPDSLSWEVEAAHIVPHRFMGKDDIWNGISLCRLHHWAFDVGWFTLSDDYSLIISPKINNIPEDFGQIWDYNFIQQMSSANSKLLLPQEKQIFPHINSIQWHRQNIFSK